MDATLLASHSPPRHTDDVSLASLILNHQNTGIAVVNHCSEIICWNSWVVKWSGISADQALGKRLEALLPSVHGTELSEAITAVIEEDKNIIWSRDSAPTKIETIETSVEGPDQARPLYSVAFSPIALPGGAGCLLEFMEVSAKPSLAVKQRSTLTLHSPKSLAVDGAIKNVKPRGSIEVVNTKTTDSLEAYVVDNDAGVIAVDRFGIIQKIDSRFEALSAFTTEELKHKPLRLLFPAMPTGSEAGVEQFFEQYSRRDQLVEAASAEGKTFKLHVSIFPAEDGNDGLRLVCRDTTQELRRENALSRQRELFEALYSEVADGIALVDKQGIIEGINPVGLEMLGLHDNELVNQPADELIQLVDGMDAAIKAVSECLTRGSVFYTPSQTTLKMACGNQIEVSASVTPLRAGDNSLSGCVMVFRTVTESRRVSQRLTWQVDHDPLTGLDNRHSLEREIVRAMNDVQRSNLVSVLLYIDLYNFSLVNDTCGHVAGDTLLRQTAKIIRSKAGNQALVARIGNDEFGVLLRDQEVDSARLIAEEILEELRDFSFPWGERRLKVGANIGMEVIDRDASSEIDVLVSAAASCETAKELGRNRLHCTYQRENIDRRDRIVEWIPKISAALDENRFELYFQPIVPMASISDVNPSKAGGHYEALVRMVDTEGNLVSPDQFIPAAERYGLIDDIDRWVVAEAIRILGKIGKSRRRDLRFSVNLSGATIGDEAYADYLIAALDSSGISPHHFQFEITETAAIRKFDRALDFIHRLKAKGCLFSLDDFGSGLSSLSYLKDIPVDYLKIDGSFVRNMETSDIDFSVVSTVNHLAHVMGVSTIAECVENQFQLSMLQDMGVDYVQGYFLAAPRPASEVFG